MTLPIEPAQYQNWLAEIEHEWLAGKRPDPQAVAIIVENMRGEILLQLREDIPGLEFANWWTLPGGVVEPDETPVQAAHRELKEETGLQLPLTSWKVYRRRHPSRKFMIEQHIFVGQTKREAHNLILGEGQALRFVGQADASSLPITFGFDDLLKEFWLLRA